MIRIVVDSTADIPPDLRAAYGIAVVPILIQFGRTTFRDTVDLSRDEFYRRLVEEDELPQTAAPPVGLFGEEFRAQAASGDPVIAICLAGKLSATLSAAQQAAQMIEGAQIVCVDSGTVAAPMAYLAVAAAQAAREGRTVEEIVALIEKLRERAVLYVALETLRYLEKGGRIGRMRALLGTMLNVKPILEVRNGEVHPVEQVRTWKRVPARMVEIMAARGRLAELSVLYTTTRDTAERLAELCAESGLAARERIQVIQAAPALGVHVGPGALGLAGLLEN